MSLGPGTRMPIFQGMDSNAWMQLAFDEALKVKGKTLPNPAVGAILVKRGRLLAVGGTQAAGQAHAEIMALRAAGDKARGSSLYVTLEPCCHYGRTPPCTEAIIAAGIKHVFVSHRDPNPKVAGEGVAQLRRAGIEVTEGVLASQGEAFYRHFAFFIRHGRPRILLKIAQSLDGHINASPGKRTAITGSESQKVSHQLRIEADAWAIGAETLRCDNPDLRPRLVSGPTPEALVLTRGLQPLPRRANLFSPHREGKVRVLSPVRPSSLPEHIAHSGLPKVTRHSGKALVKNLLQDFREQGYHLVVLEGGRSLWHPFLQAEAWDELWLFTAPRFLPRGETWSGDLSRGWDKDLVFRSFTALGEDTLTVFQRHSPAAKRND